MGGLVDGVVPVAGGTRGGSVSFPLGEVGAVLFESSVAGTEESVPD